MEKLMSTVVRMTRGKAPHGRKVKPLHHHTFSYSIPCASRPHHFNERSSSIPSSFIQCTHILDLPRQAPKRSAGTQPTPAGGSFSTPKHVRTHNPQLHHLYSILHTHLIITVLLLPTSWSLPRPSVPIPYGTSLYATVNTNSHYNFTSPYNHTFFHLQHTTPQHHHLSGPVITIMEQHP